ncbi:hypothetical protein KIL84_013086 [Mauremys mutica]|uniref:Uncharacterized protein n=1 Tax=Mauremys mutica TaxID=74926 RepID=A0A9D4B974_9SAUR|nr:hypothetical protein KIL84_013086 [Mauremys mutica]
MCFAPHSLSLAGSAAPGPAWGEQMLVGTLPAPQEGAVGEVEEPPPAQPPEGRGWGNETEPSVQRRDPPGKGQGEISLAWLLLSGLVSPRGPGNLGKGGGEAPLDCGSSWSL